MSERPNYETMYILRPDIAEDEVETHTNKYRDLVIENGGTIIDNQQRGKRRLAYNIGKHREGVYVQLNYSGDGKQVGPLERAMRLSEDVIRYLTVKYEGQHSSLGRSTTPVAPMESSAPVKIGSWWVLLPPYLPPATTTKPPCWRRFSPIGSRQKAESSCKRSGQWKMSRCPNGLRSWNPRQQISAGIWS